MFSKTKSVATKSPEKNPNWNLPTCHLTRMDTEGFQLLAEIAFAGQPPSFTDHNAALAKRIESSDELSKLRSVEAIHAAKTSEHAKVLESLKAVEEKIAKEKCDLASDDSMQRLRTLTKEQDIVVSAIDAANKELAVLKNAIEQKREAVRQLCVTAHQDYREEIYTQTGVAKDVAERNLFDKAGPELVAIAQAAVDSMNANSISIPGLLSQFGIS